MYDLFPVSHQAMVNKMHIGMRGLFYDPRGKYLLVGIVLPGGLKGRVIHSGLTQSDIDEGRFFKAWNTGYTYNQWCMHDLHYVGKYRSYTSSEAYFDFLKTADIDTIKSYQAAKLLLIDNKTI